MKRYFRTLLSASFAFVLACTSLGVLAAPLRPFAAHSFADIRAQHAGKPLVVHIWAMSCGPCLVELPKWGEFARSHPGIDLVLIRFDQAPSDASEKRLVQGGLGGIESWGVVSEPDEYLRASVDPRWIGDMPRTLLIAPNGEVTPIRGIADLQRVGAWLDANAAVSRKGVR